MPLPSGLNKKTLFQNKISKASSLLKLPAFKRLEALKN
jgi:hypothetical protein